MTLKQLLFTPKPGQTASAWDAVTLKSIAKHAVIVGVASVATYLLANVGSLTGAFHLSGNNEMMAGMAVSWILKTAIEYFNGQISAQPPVPPGLPGAPNAQ